MRLMRTAAVAAFLGVSCAPSDKLGIADRAQIVQAVSAGLEVWGRAVSNRELDTLAQLYIRTADLPAVWMDGARTRGWKDASAERKRWSDSLSQLNFVIEDANIDVLDRQVALATFRTTIDAIAGRARARSHGRGTQVWMRDPGDQRWKIRAEHESILFEDR